tara:strand:+ start:561 stop:1301 length:741 start_codon:yes stop_codon:yes gene_type:complete
MLKNKKFKNFLKNKRVVLVGPASYLSYLNYGEKIESYDLVVRVNRGMELIEENSIHLGKRTDILYNCLIEHPDNGGKIDIKFLKKNNVKWICTIPNSNAEGKPLRFLHPQVKLSTYIKLKLFMNFHTFNLSEYAKLNKKIKCRANTGFAAIFDILNCDIKELFLTGFSFYLDSFFKGYKKDCTRDEEEFAKQCFASVRHNQFNQWKLLKELNDERLSFDPVLKEIISLEELDRNQFNNIIKKISEK